ncbi:hypothetical protein AMTR_s00020p00176110 [Amborella trichopoda]|uniref:Uncharacterized protein n=1 Tax=Amborella trichopoda TaxID=13333 RepID=W1PVY1_AMBTC|nr:hypothetical protein AMTR_s00020p00176110 [Amborella trichopoda]
MATCPHMLKIAAMIAVVKELDVVRELLTDASFFTRERSFAVGGPSNNIFIDAFDLMLNKVVTETKEATYLMSVQGCILPFRFVVPHYGRVGHKTVSYRWWWDSSNAKYWDVDHPWQTTSGSRRNGRAERRFVPPLFSVIFGLDHYPTN